jgi:hypothetical protein
MADDDKKDPEKNQGDAGGDAGGKTDPEAGKAGGSGEGGGDGAGDKGRTFTQAELDDQIGKRLARERKKWGDDQAAEAEKAKMTEAERLKADKAEADKAAKESQLKASQRIIRSEARIAFSAAGVKPDRLDYALRLADLSGVEVGEDGEPDLKAIHGIVQQVTKDLPELVAAGGGNAGGKGGGDFGGKQEGDKPLTDELKRRMPEVSAFYDAQGQKQKG